MKLVPGLSVPRRLAARLLAARLLAPRLLARTRLVPTVLIALALVLPARAMAEPKLEMHRVGATADDGSGWHLAVSSNGSFSVLMPLPVNDFTTRDAAAGDAATYVIGAKSTEGIKVAVVELPASGRRLPDLASIPQTLANATSTVSDVKRTTSDGADMLTLTVANAASTLHMKCIDIKGTRYNLTIEFPNGQRELVTSIKDKFFDSFRLKTKS